MGKHTGRARIAKKAYFSLSLLTLNNLRVIVKATESNNLIESAINGDGQKPVKLLSYSPFLLCG